MTSKSLLGSLPLEGLSMHSVQFSRKKKRSRVMKIIFRKPTENLHKSLKHSDLLLEDDGDGDGDNG